MNILINTEPGLEDGFALKVAYLWTEFGAKCEHLPLFTGGWDSRKSQKEGQYFLGKWLLGNHVGGGVYKRR